MIAAALIGATTAPAMAQDNPQQTPENAHAFLQKLVSLGTLEIGSKNDGDPDSCWNAAGFPGKPCRDWPDISIVRYSITNPCKVRLDVTNPSEAERFWGGYGDGYTTLDFPVLTNIKVDGKTILFVNGKIRHGQQRLDFLMRLSLPSPDLAARAAQAMEVIRASCDATAGTGF